MHEMSLASSLIATVEEAAREAHAQRVLRIALTVGELSQVVGEAMSFAFELLSKGTLCEGAQLEMNFVGAASRCAECGCEFEHDAWHRQCPQCGSMLTAVLRGREFEVDSIEVDIP